MNTSKKIRVIAALGSLSGAVWAGTFATFTDSATSASTFSSGTVDMELNDDATDAYSFASLSTSNMKPGDVKYAALKVENAGSIASTYTMTSAESEAVLSGQLQLGAVTGATTCDAAGYAALTTTVVIANGSLASAAISTARPLAAATSELLCFKVELPTASGDTFQGLTTTSTFTFSLTQA
ncbi:MAG: M73 family metallopeptidase [Actinobacteria bacterium]|nr:M73 family metallopeptidase [Actinomycetota bacterium]MBW3648370.1 M73 family metallopeptidase [Actinomycetota bacterium]